ncbi:hypothetical protein C4573_02600 [Candidatus Woesearchaeota archaeon]|nr:MAG: hypothetical protein C4573_02600 [Candidatus Woesearchaeota archaeon]
METISEKEKKIETLAKTLRLTGFASSDTQAKKMAEEMLGIDEKIQKQYADADKAVKKPQVIPEKMPEAIKTAETSDFPEDTPLGELMRASENKKEVSAEEEQTEEPQRQEQAEKISLDDEAPEEVTAETESSEEPEMQKENTEEETEKKEETAPEPAKKEQPKEENKVDLSEIFNFGKR